MRNAATRAAHLFRLWKNILYLNDSVQWCNVIKVKQFSHNQDLYFGKPLGNH